VKAHNEAGAARPARLKGETTVKRLKQRAQLPAFSPFDALLAPSAPGAAPRGLEDTGSPVMQAPWTILGLPAISLPIGLNKGGLPLGIQIIGPPRAEDRLFAAALWCERALDIHLRPPL